MFTIVLSCDREGEKENSVFVFGEHICEMNGSFVLFCFFLIIPWDLHAVEV